jgi:HEAT repeat protein
MNPDDLDRQLEAALAAQPSPEQTARLVAFWREQSRAERRRRRMIQATALAATLLTAVAASLWLARPRAPEPVTVAAQAPKPATPEDSSSSAVVRVAHEIRDPRSAGRAPTAYEQAMFAAVTRTSVDVHARSLGVEVDALIERLAADPAANAGEMARDANLAERGAENILLRRLSRAQPHKRRAIVQLLAACGSARSAPALLDAARRDELRPDALAALEQILGVESLAQAIPMTHHRQVRAALLDRLLAAGSPVALRSFLQLASNRGFRPDVLAAAMACRAFPVEPLLAALEDENKQIRLAAAIVLGHVDGPQVAQSLIAIASRRDGAPVEAWVALLACRDAAADRFLAQASMQPRWLGQVNNARVYWARFIP